MSTIRQDIDMLIGARIHTEREVRGWSLNDLAKRSGVSRAMIHKVERGESSATASLLARLSGALQLTMSALIARAELQEGRLLRRIEQPQWVDPETKYVRRHVSPRMDIPLDLVEVELPAKTEIAMPACAYRFLKQMIWILDGTLVFVEGQTRHELKEGDCLVLGPPADCIFKNETRRACRYAVVVLSSHE